jgi:hypothetical protein
VQILIAVLGALNFLWLLFVNVFYAMYYYNRNPFSRCFMTCSSNWHSLGRFVIKIAPMIYLLYDQAFEFQLLFLIIMSVSYAGYLAAFSRLLFSFYRYNFHLEKMLMGIEIFMGLFNFLFIVVFAFQDPEGKTNLLMPAWSLFSLLMSLTVVDLAEKMKRSKIKDINSVDKKGLPELLEFLIYLIY